MCRVTAASLTPGRAPAKRGGARTGVYGRRGGVSGSVRLEKHPKITHPPGEGSGVVRSHAVVCYMNCTRCKQSRHKAAPTRTKLRSRAQGGHATLHQLLQLGLFTLTVQTAQTGIQNVYANGSPPEAPTEGVQPYCVFEIGGRGGDPFSCSTASAQGHQR